MISQWYGAHKCDLCAKKNLTELYDAKTRFGFWATLCPECFTANGLGIGPGRGQHYKRGVDGHLYKVAG